MYGLEGQLAIDRENSISYSFCQHVVTLNRLFVVENARKHPLVAENLGTTELGVQAYAGAPIHADGQPIGALCIVSQEPRNWTNEELDVLETLAQAVNTEMALVTRQRFVVQARRPFTRGAAES
jgi:GAF domain-containing protein